MILERFATHRDVGTFGQLRLDGLRFWTVERPWLDNAKWESCIPAGDYSLSPSRWYSRDIPTYEVMDVPGRSRILLHPANTFEQVQGCIAPGKALGMVDGLWAVTSSRAAFNELMVEIKATDDLVLSVRWAEVG